MRSGEIKLFVGILVVALALVGFAIYPMVIGPPKPPETDVRPAPGMTRDNLVPSWAHRKGDPKAPYTLVEFGDYQCPTCGAAQPLVDEELDKHKDKLDYVFHFCRIASAHYNADMLAMAAEAANEQGKFWEMHEMLFQHQKDLSTRDQGQLADLLMGLAAKLKLNAMDFRQALTDSKAREAVSRMQHLGDDSRLHGTPTFFVLNNSDGKAIMQVNEPDKLKNWLDTPANLGGSAPGQPASAPAKKV